MNSGLNEILKSIIHTQTMLMSKLNFISTGPKGQPGTTPVRGQDYWTASDIQEIQNYIDSKLDPIETRLKGI